MWGVDVCCGEYLRIWGCFSRKLNYRGLVRISEKFVNFYKIIEFL